MKVRLVDPVSRKVQPLLEDAKGADLKLAPDGSRAFVLRQKNPDKIVWTDIETWDGKKLVGVSGDWVKGDLKPEKITVYDTSSLVK